MCSHFNIGSKENKIGCGFIVLLQNESVKAYLPRFFPLVQILVSRDIFVILRLFPINSQSQCEPSQLWILGIER